MISFEHVGLRNIKRFVPTFNPSDLRYLFLVHTAADDTLDDPSFRLPGFEQVHQKAETLDDYPLTILFKLDDHKGEAEVVARFDSAVIPADQIQSVLRQFEHNVVQLATSASSDDQTNVTGQPSLGCVHDLFIRSLETSPDSQAVCSWDGEFTYRELDQAARILAQLLVAEGGVGTEVAVGLCMDKSRWAMVAVLAILYAGGAVVPLGVDLPPERISVILQDSSPTMVLCDEAKADRFRSLGCNIAVVNETEIDGLAKFYDGYSPNIPSTSVSAENMAWIIYTSGSTGVPKGVTLEHGGIYNIILNKGTTLGFDSTTRTFQFAAFTFDVSIADPLMAWAFGGCVCLPSEDERMNDLVGSINRLNANFSLLTASTAALITPSEVPRMTKLLLGGESNTPSLMEKWLLDSNITVGNSYGPAECSITSTINARVTDKNGCNIIGNPIQGTQAWIADFHDCNRLVPIGAVGELLIEGPHVARGYRNDPVKTMAAFITDPRFTTDVGPKRHGRRMYRSGDLVQYTSDGNIEFLGRGDSQIKIRGQRVDLGEIESCIVKLVPKVRTALVEYLHLSEDQRALIAALEFHNVDKDQDVEGLATWLKESLAQQLPAYMIPRAYLQIDMIPKTVSGKTNSKAIRQFMMNKYKQIADENSLNDFQTEKVDTES
ncbi:unnamed protein product [Fusarium graminearum]|nr:unnamed protein product [Fusarium graminearum]